MAKPDKHVFVCRNLRPEGSVKPSCERRGAAEVFEMFKKARAEAGISKTTKLTKVQCFGKCEHGPNAVVYPDGVWYCGLTEDDAAEIVREHLLNGRPVKRKMLDDDLI